MLAIRHDEPDPEGVGAAHVVRGHVAIDWAHAQGGRISVLGGITRGATVLISAGGYRSMGKHGTRESYYC